jgi:hypothetical protein
MTLSVSLFLRDEEDPKRFAAEPPATDTLVTNEPPSQEVDVAAKPQKAAKKPTKKAVTIHSSRRLQKASDTAVLPLKSISPQAPPTTCVNILLYLLQLLCVDAHILFSR